MPEVIENPVTGQRVTFVEHTLEVLATEWVVQPGRPTDPEHIHPNQEEHIHLLEGTIRRDLGGGKSDELGQGGEWVIAPGVPHTWANATDRPIKLRIEFRPALRTQAFMTRIYGLAAAGQTNAQGIPNLLQIAVLAQEYRPEFQITSPPPGVQKVAFAVLAPIGRLFGYRV